MNHPCVTTLEKDSAPRVLFAGDQLVEVDLPPGTRCIYPKPPIQPLRDVDAAIRYAINHPLGCEPLYAKLRPGMKVTIAMDDISLPLPPMRGPDVRERVLEIVLALMADHGVDDIEIIVATGIHRRMKAAEVRHMVGRRVFEAYWPDRLYNHDAEDRDNLVEVATTDHGEVIEMNRRAVESDLIIYVNLNFVPMDGGHKSLMCGLTSYRSLRGAPQPRDDPRLRQLHGPAQERAGDSGRAHGSPGQRRSSTSSPSRPRSTTACSTDRWSSSPRTRTTSTGGSARCSRAWSPTTARLPQVARQAIFDRFPAPYGVTGVWAGETEAVHEKTLERCFEQYSCPSRVRPTCSSAASRTSARTTCTPT